jgi:hypothetical protein
MSGWVHRNFSVFWSESLPKGAQTGDNATIKPLMGRIVIEIV